MYDFTVVSNTHTAFIDGFLETVYTNFDVLIHESKNMFMLVFIHLSVFSLKSQLFV